MRIEGQNSPENRKLTRKKSYNFQIKKINPSVEISCSIDEEYVVSNVFVGTDSQVRAEKTILEARMNLNYRTHCEMSLTKNLLFKQV